MHILAPSDKRLPMHGLNHYKALYASICIDSHRLREQQQFSLEFETANTSGMDAQNIS